MDTNEVKHVKGLEMLLTSIVRTLLGEMVINRCFIDHHTEEHACVSACLRALTKLCISDGHNSIVYKC